MGIDLLNAWKCYILERSQDMPCLLTTLKYNLEYYIPTTSMKLHYVCKHEVCETVPNIPWENVVSKRQHASIF